MKEKREKRAAGFYISCLTILISLAAGTTYLIADFGETYLNNDQPVPVLILIVLTIVAEVLFMGHPSLGAVKVAGAAILTAALCLAVWFRVDYVIEIASHNNQVAIQPVIIVSIVLFLLGILTEILSAFLKQKKEETVVSAVEQMQENPEAEEVERR